MEQKAAVEGKGKTIRRQRLVSGPKLNAFDVIERDGLEAAQKSWAEQLTTCPRQLTNLRLRFRSTDLSPFFAFVRLLAWDRKMRTD
jgi:hypothetical protein